MTTNTLRERVFAAIPEYVASQTILENRGSVELPPMPTVDDAHRDLIRSVRRHVIDGTAIPVELADAVLAAERDRERFTTLTNALRSVEQTARDNIANAREFQWAESIEILNAELSDIVATARTIAGTLDGITTAADALASRDARTADAWRELQGLAGRYDEVRLLQVEITPRDIPQRAEKLYSTGLFRDAITVSSYFARRSRGTITHTRDGAERRFDGHRVDGDESWWPTDIDRAGALLRIIQADPWVPTSDVMEQAFALASAATSDNLSQYDDARAAEITATRTADYYAYVEQHP